MRRMTSFRKYIDIGANLTDDMYQGVYHGSKKHEPDLDKVLNRSWSNGMTKMIITGGSLADSKKAIEMARSDFGTTQTIQLLSVIRPSIVGSLKRISLK